MRTPEEARRIIEAHRGEKFANSMVNRGAAQFCGLVEIEDLRQAASIGLHIAAMEFREDEGVRFSTYARYVIWGKIIDAVRDATGMRRRHLQLLKVSRAHREATRSAVIDAPDGTAGDALSSGVGEIVRRMSPGKTAECIEEVAFEEGTSAEYDRLMRPRSTYKESPERLFRMRQLVDGLTELFDYLPPDEKKLLSLVYLEDWTLVDVARVEGRSASWASRVHLRGLRRLRRLGVARGLLSGEQEPR